MNIFLFLNVSNHFIHFVFNYACSLIEISAIQIVHIHIKNIMDSGNYCSISLKKGKKTFMNGNES